MSEKKTDWILHNSVDHIMYKLTIPGLTDEELFYCLAYEKRITGIRQLQREARKRLRKRLKKRGVNRNGKT